MEQLLKVENLVVRFGGIIAVNSVSFEVPRGSIFAIIGPNGAGKTTIFNAISGIYRPDSGSIHYNNECINNLAPYTIAKKGIARTFQNIELFARMTAMENIMLGRHLHMKTGLLRGAFMYGKKSRVAREEVENRQKAEYIIDLLELQSVRDKFVGDLPYGKQKLVELARALALEPGLLLLDEPSAGMNSEEKQDLFFWIKDIQQELDTTILMIEHDMKMVMDISDTVLAINFGVPIAMGDPLKVAEHPEVLKAYLGEENSA
jgi:branched-chain amino acid transport system ATP-binding protein